MDKGSVYTGIFIIILAVGLIGYGIIYTSLQNDKEVQPLSSNEGAVAELQYASYDLGKTGATWEFKVNISENCTFFKITSEDIQKISNLTISWNDVYIQDMVEPSLVISLDDDCLKVSIMPTTHQCIFTVCEGNGLYYTFLISRV